jgi:hypothetical protein
MFRSLGVHPFLEDENRRIESTIDFINVLDRALPLIEFQRGRLFFRKPESFRKDA